VRIDQVFSLLLAEKRNNHFQQLTVCEIFPERQYYLCMVVGLSNELNPVDYEKA
jgi:hypothetical protein